MSKGYLDKVHEYLPIYISVSLPLCVSILLVHYEFFKEKSLWSVINITILPGYQ